MWMGLLVALTDLRKAGIGCQFSYPSNALLLAMAHFKPPLSAPKRLRPDQRGKLSKRTVRALYGLYEATYSNRYGRG